MSEFVRLASQRVLDEVRPQVRALAARTAWASVAGLLLTAAVAFALAAVTVALVRAQGGVVACIIMAAGFALAGVLVLILGRARSRPVQIVHVPPPAEPPWVSLLGMATTAGLSEIFVSQRRARLWAPVVLGLSVIALNSVLSATRQKPHDT